MDEPQTAGWQPIETAPRDGRSLLLLCDWEPIWFVGYYGVGAPGDRLPHDKQEWRVKWDQSPIDEGYEATHWMPLPELPEQGTSDNG